MRISKKPPVLWEKVSYRQRASMGTQAEISSESAGAIVLLVEYDNVIDILNPDLHLVGLIGE